MSDPESNLGPGTTLDERYELAEEIARGGFGLVYRARQLNMDRQVAIKMVPPDYMEIPDVVQRFEREARLASRLNHPNTITVHDYGRHEDYLFLVMELLEGEDLADILARDRTVELSRIADISRQVLKSLHEAHQHGIIHRDLKPENIFLTEISGESDFVKVVDFGIAKLAMPEMASAEMDDSEHEQRNLTVEGNTVGTPTYMSPEQAAGGSVDARSDLYALGVMMYEMAAGHPPFDADDPAQLMREHIFEEIPEFSEERLRTSWLQPVVQRAMAKQKDDRFPDAGAFIDAIDYAIRASDDDRAFAPTREHESVEAEQDRSAEAVQESDEVLAEPSSDDHAVPEPGVAAPETPTDAPRFDSSSERGSENPVVQPPSREENTGSSIMTVLEESSEDDVIVLDQPKETSTEGTDPVGGDDRRDEPVVLGETDEPAPTTGRSDDSRGPPSDPLEETTPNRGAREADGSHFGGGARAEFSGESSVSDSDERNRQSWSWGDEHGAEDLETGEEISVEFPRRSSRWRRLALFLLVLAAAAAGTYLYLQGIPSRLPTP